jgi:hypothetical protein
VGIQKVLIYFVLFSKRLDLLQLIARGHCLFSTIRKLLFCTLQRIHSSVALLPDYFVKKSCNSGEDWIAVCKPIFSDCKRTAMIARY